MFFVKIPYTFEEGEFTIRKIVWFENGDIYGCPCCLLFSEEEGEADSFLGQSPPRHQPPSSYPFFQTSTPSGASDPFAQVRQPDPGQITTPQAPPSAIRQHSPPTLPPAPGVAPTSNSPPPAVLSTPLIGKLHHPFANTELLIHKQALFN